MTADYRAASAHLATLDADWARLIERVGPCTLAPRPEREPFEALVRAVAYQQLHARAAERILQRLLALYPDAPFPTPTQLLATPVERLRTAGLSARKAQSLQDIAAGALDGRVPSRAEAETLDDEELVRRLSGLRGIGRWSVEMLLIFTLERPDVLPVDDFGVRSGYRRLKGLERLPTPRELARIGQAYRPWRTVAAWYLWRVPSDAA
ncbi:DNA-3-methyladenine glycosylase [Pseudomonas stutzeri]|nr:DNA-3-methyladenine glycosylase [Stutzerimonas stutzeri]